MKRRVAVTPAARKELDDLLEVIARDQPQAAERLIDDFARFVSIVAENPDSGIAWHTVRRFVLTRFGVLVFYRVLDERTVLVLRILHGGRDLNAHLNELLDEPE